MPRSRQASEETQEKACFLLRFFIASRTASPSAPAVISNLLFYLSVGSCKSAVDTLISIAICLSRDLKFRLTAQAPFHFVECVVLLQRIALQLPTCREERRDSKERRGDPSPLLTLAVHGGSEGLLTGQQSLRTFLSPFLSANNQI